MIGTLALATGLTLLTVFFSMYTSRYYLGKLWTSLTVVLVIAIGAFFISTAAVQVYRTKLYHCKCIHESLKEQMLEQEWPDFKEKESLEV